MSSERRAIADAVDEARVFITTHAREGVTPEDCGLVRILVTGELRNSRLFRDITVTVAPNPGAYCSISLTITTTTRRGQTSTTTFER